MDATKIEAGQCWAEGGRFWVVLPDDAAMEMGWNEDEQYAAQKYRPVVDLRGTGLNGIRDEDIPSMRRGIEDVLVDAGQVALYRERIAELERLLRVARSFLPLCIFQSGGTDMVVVIDEIDDALSKESSTP